MSESVSTRRMSFLVAIGAVLLAVGVSLAGWSSTSEEGMLSDIGDAFTFDAEDAAEYAEKYGQGQRCQAEARRDFGGARMLLRP
jgi:hypothetical protein